MTKRRILQPQYVGKFKCRGPECEDSCCLGWQVFIDKDTYQQYRNCPDEILRSQMNENVKRIRTNAGVENYAKIKLNEDGSCPFLDDGKLCTIQRRLGEEYLSRTCTTYPRLTNIVNGVLERSLTMSCPEAAKLALLNPELMEFDETEEAAGIRFIAGTVVNTDEVNSGQPAAKYFWELRVFIISLLQNRSYLLWERLVILGLFCKNITDAVADGRVREIPLIIGTYLNRLEQGVYRQELTAIPDKMTIQMELMKELVEQRLFTGVNSQRFLECCGKFLQGIQYTADSKIEESGERYAAAYEKYYKPFMARHEYILENYLVNFAFKNLFPIQGEKHIFDNYIRLIINYAMIKMLLIGLAGYYQENFGFDQVVELIQSFAKVIEHNDNFMRQVFQLLKNNNMNTMAYMAILIKN